MIALDIAHSICISSVPRRLRSSQRSRPATGIRLASKRSGPKTSGANFGRLAGPEAIAKHADDPSCRALSALSQDPEDGGQRSIGLSRMVMLL